MSKKMGRPKIVIDENQLRSLLRLRPTLEDCANFFQCSQATIEKHINDKFDLTFKEFRDQNFVHTRFSVVRAALQKAMNGDTALMIFCLKNMAGWKDRHESDEVNASVTVMLGYNPEQGKLNGTTTPRQATIDAEATTVDDIDAD